MKWQNGSIRPGNQQTIKLQRNGALSREPGLGAKRTEGPQSAFFRYSDLSRSGCEALLCGAYVNALNIRSVHS